MSDKFTIMVRPKGLLQPPLLATTEAEAVEIYAPDGELVGVLHKVLDGSCYVFTSKLDKDWPQVLSQLGYINAHVDAARRPDFFQARK